ncbi:MAG: hypothetical protein ACUZ8N_10195 [Candidatus Scalindua sp.]
MEKNYDIGTGDYLAEEKIRYGYKDKTGYLQEIIEGEIEKELQKRDIEKSIETMNLRIQVEELALQLRTLTQRLEMVEKHEAIENVIEVRDIPIEKIKEEMLSLLSDGKTIWADEIAEQLNLDMRDVVKAFKQLQEEGKLFIDDKI